MKQTKIRGNWALREFYCSPGLDFWAVHKEKEFCHAIFPKIVAKSAVFTAYFILVNIFRDRPLKSSLNTIGA